MATNLLSGSIQGEHELKMRANILRGVTQAQMALPKGAELILLAVVGSQGLGLATPESDVDVMGVCVEPERRVIGFNPFDQLEMKLDGMEGTIYGLRKFTRLALGGNPTVLGCLYAPSWATPGGQQLRAISPLFHSRDTINAFVGYLSQQRARLLGERGQKGVKRPDLEEKFGYDTKYAMHMVRLGLQGLELAKTHRLSYPMKEEDRTLLMNIRNGGLTQEECVELAEGLEAQLRALGNTETLASEPYRYAAETTMMAIYNEYWGYKL